MSAKKRALIVGLSIFSGIVFILIAFVAYTVQQANYIQGVIGSELNRVLGFTHGSPYIIIDGSGEEVFVLHPTANGIMDKAGVEDGDIVLEHSITGFYRQLHEHRGSTMTFAIAEGGNGAAIASRLKRTIELSIPKK